MSGRCLGHIDGYAAGYLQHGRPCPVRKLMLTHPATELGPDRSGRGEARNALKLLTGILDWQAVAADGKGLRGLGREVSAHSTGPVSERKEGSRTGCFSPVAEQA